MESIFNKNEKVKTIHDEIGEIKAISFNERLEKNVYLIYFGNSKYMWYTKDELKKV